MYFPRHKLAIEIDEKGHTDRNEKKKKNEREGKIKKKLVLNLLELIWIKNDYDEYVEFGEI